MRDVPPRARARRLRRLAGVPPPGTRSTWSWSRTAPTPPSRARSAPGTAPACSSPARTSGYGRAANLGAVRRDHALAGGGQPRHGLGSRCPGRAARRGAASPTGRRARPPGAQPGRHGVPVGPRAAQPEPRCRARHARRGSGRRTRGPLRTSTTSATSPTPSATAGWLSGSCLLLRREAFDAVGGFDEGYFMFFEDVDLGDRLGRAAGPASSCPSAGVTHAQGTSWRERPEAMIRAHHHSAARYLARRYPRWYQWPVRASLRAGLAVRPRDPGASWPAGPTRPDRRRGSGHRGLDERAAPRGRWSRPSAAATNAPTPTRQGEVPPPALSTST